MLLPALDHHQKITGNLAQLPFLINIINCGAKNAYSYLGSAC